MTIGIDSNSLTIHNTSSAEERECIAPFVNPSACETRDLDRWLTDSPVCSLVDMFDPDPDPADLDLCTASDADRCTGIHERRAKLEVFSIKVNQAELHLIRAALAHFARHNESREFEPHLEGLRDRLRTTGQW